MLISNLNKEVLIVMGSQSDWKTLKSCKEILDNFKIKNSHFIVSAHRTPKRLFDFTSKLNDKVTKIIIAGAGGAAHLPGMIASMTSIPVLGVPIQTKTLKGIDSLLSIAQMPFGIPVGTLAIGEAGAKNAALFAVSILSMNNEKILKNYKKWRLQQSQKIKLKPSYK